MSAQVLPSKTGCSCDPAFHMSVLMDFSSEGVFACLHCGTVLCSQVIGDDGRGGGESWTAIIAVEMPKAALDWLGQWPRKYREEEQTYALYLPAKTRYSSLERMKEDAARQLENQQQWSLREKFQEAGYPKGDLPEGLPYMAQRFIEASQALALDPSSNIEKLAETAMLSRFGFELLKDDLLKQPDIDDWLCQWITFESNDMYWYSKNVGMPYFLAYDLIKAKKSASPKVMDTLLRNIAEMPVQRSPYGHNELLYDFKLNDALSVLRSIKVNASDAIQAVHALKSRIQNKEVTALNAINRTLAHLNGQPGA